MNHESPIAQIMTKALVTVSPATSLHDIRDIFNEHNFHHLPVLDVDDNLVGIISKTDLFNAMRIWSVKTTGKTWTHIQLDTQTAIDIMSADPVCLEADDTIGLAADIFMANRFHALPVVDGSQLLGIVTTHDLIKYAFDTTFSTT